MQRISNPEVHNGLGQPVAYKLTPHASPTPLAGEASSIASRAGFATQNLWVTPYVPEERRAAGEHPNQHEAEQVAQVLEQQLKAQR